MLEFRYLTFQLLSAGSGYFGGGGAGITWCYRSGGSGDQGPGPGMDGSGLVVGDVVEMVLGHQAQVAWLVEWYIVHVSNLINNQRIAIILNIYNNCQI